MADQVSLMEWVFCLKIRNDRSNDQSLGRVLEQVIVDLVLQPAAILLPDEKPLGSEFGIIWFFLWVIDVQGRGKAKLPTNLYNNSRVASLPRDGTCKRFSWLLFTQGIKRESRDALWRQARDPKAVESEKPVSRVLGWSYNLRQLTTFVMCPGDWSVQLHRQTTQPICEIVQCVYSVLPGKLESRSKRPLNYLRLKRSWCFSWASSSWNHLVCQSGSQRLDPRCRKVGIYLASCLVQYWHIAKHEKHFWLDPSWSTYQSMIDKAKVCTTSLDWLYNSLFQWHDSKWFQ